MKNTLPFNTYQTDGSKKNYTHHTFSKGGEIIHKLRWIKKLRHICSRSKKSMVSLGNWEFHTVTYATICSLIFVAPCVMLYSSEISPTRCNNCVLFFAMALLYMFRATISPIIRSTYAVYGHR